jgi:transposase
MGQVLHGSATTTEAVRRAIQRSQESLRALARRYGVNPKTIAKWKARSSVSDLPTGPREPRSTALSVEEEAVVVAFRRHTLLPLDDCLYALQPTIPHLTRSSLHRCLQRHGISRLPQIEGEASPKRKFKTYPIGFFHVDIAEVQTAQGKLYLFVAIDRVSKFARRQGQYADRARLLGGPCRRRALQDRDRAHRQRRPIRRPAKEPIRPNRHAPRPSFRSRLSGTWDRTSTDQAQSSLDQWTGRADEPDNQGRDRQAISLRISRSTRSASRRLRRRLQLRPATEDP